MAPPTKTSGAAAPRVPTSPGGQDQIPRHINGEDRRKTADLSHPSGNPAFRRPSTEIAINSGEKARDQNALYRAIVIPG